MRRYYLALATLFAAGALETHGEQTVLTHLGFLTCSLAVTSDAPEAERPWSATADATNAGI